MAEVNGAPETIEFPNMPASGASFPAGAVSQMVPATGSEETTSCADSSLVPKDLKFKSEKLNALLKDCAWQGTLFRLAIAFTRYGRGDLDID